VKKLQYDYVCKQYGKKLMLPDSGNYLSFWPSKRVKEHLFKYSAVKLCCKVCKVIYLFKYLFIALAEQWFLEAGYEEGQ